MEDTTPTAASPDRAHGILPTIRRFLRQPFPFQVLFSRPYLTAGGIGLFIFLFLVVFSPFDFADDNLQTPRPVAALVYGIIPGLVILAHRFVFRAYLEEYTREDQWTFGKELLLYFSILLVTGFLNSLASVFVDTYAPIRMMFRELHRDMYHTFAIGFLPIVILNLISLIVLLRRNRASSSEVNAAISQHTPIAQPSPIVHFKATTKKDEFEVPLDDILFIKAVGNYLDVYLKGGERKTLRLSVQQMESEMVRVPALCRVHRSYVVNLNKVLSVQGNAMGLVLTFSNNLSVPVARSRMKEFKSAIETARRPVI